ncbi:hypothetical protein ABE218_03230 [Bacillus smithii]|uniref:hypothetical protein n=1 Tax=Bacillus smithii TaxID=1479 RepID=UPI003D1E3DDE
MDRAGCRAKKFLETIKERGDEIVKDAEQSLSKNIVLAILDTVTLGIPIYAVNFIKRPKKTLKFFSLSFPLFRLLLGCLRHGVNEDLEVRAFYFVFFVGKDEHSVWKRDRTIL